MLVAGLWFASPTIVNHSMNGLETGLYFLVSLATLNLFASFIEDSPYRFSRKQMIVWAPCSASASLSAVTRHF